MKNLKVLNEENLLHNLECFKDKKICAMVKANAYGHGLKDVVKMAEGKVAYFGVVSVDEGVAVRKITDKPILICAKVDDFKTCKKRGLEVFVDDELDIRKCLDVGLKNSMHLKINCGMNRFGVKSSLNMKLINDLLLEKGVDLKSICTHFPCTENRRQTLKNYQNFMKFRSEISQNAEICFGGSGIFRYPFDFDMIRLGIGMYGYGQRGLLPVMKICSHVCKIFFAKRGEFVGYGKKYKVKNDGFFAVVPVGYGDGLRRALGGKFVVKINEKNFKSVGDICMDAFFVKIDESVSVGDEVEVMSDAEYFAMASKTIPYEISTGFSNFRGKTVTVRKLF